MDPAPALVDVRNLARLMRSLEHASDVVLQDAEPFAVVLRSPSALDPGQSVLQAVAEPQTARADGEARWMQQHSGAVDRLLRERRAAQLNVIFPGNWPNRPHRERRHGATVRLLSAVDHLWIDRLRVHDAEGNRDERARIALIRRLAGAWSAEDERRYTPPALAQVENENKLADDSRQEILRDRVRLGGLTVLFGPGGIGKTFFLRRLAHRLGQKAISDPTVGIPTFAELPLLLHGDALETWLSHAGIRLPINDIRTLVAESVITPLLDALDELVRGQAREGSRLFLGRLRSTIEPTGRGVLSSRDYYLNLDPLVREEVAGPNTAFLTLGYFTQVGRRRYVQIRTGLNEDHAARWANRLESQAREALQGATDADLASLIGHPLFLDAFCEVILEIPSERRAVEADNFRLTSPDVFGEIVRTVLEREEGKAKPGWEAKFGRLLVGTWQAPFTPEFQRAVLSHLVLLVAQDGAAETIRRSESFPSYRQLRHGLFTYTKGTPETDGDGPKAVLRALLEKILGRPELAPGIPESESEATREAALEELAGVFLQHTLADTRPDLPDDLVFATRHRAYFDYLLAEALLEKLAEALASLHADIGADFVWWCLDHHIFEHDERTEGPPFASCLDFILWHRSGLVAIAPSVDAFLERVAADPSGVTIDADLGSYLSSLALALLLRFVERTGVSGAIIGRDFASETEWRLTLEPNIVPLVIDVAFERCSFPSLDLAHVDMTDVRVLDCDCRYLRLSDATIRHTDLEIALEHFVIDGRVSLDNCRVAIEPRAAGTDWLRLAPTAQVTLRNCRLTSPVFSMFEQASRSLPHAVTMVDCVEEEEGIVQGPPTKGQFFVNRLMSLVRKHGHQEYAVFKPKLRGLTPTTSGSFEAAIAVLERHGAVTSGSNMVYITGACEAQMYSGKNREGLRRYSDVSDYWDPIVKELDAVLT
jgi:hypothetical protein